MKLVSIVVPCHNEEGNIDKLYEEFNKVLRQDVKWEFIFVNDGSKDETVSKIKHLSSDKRVKLINFSRNFGKEIAMIAGLDHTVGDAAVIIDADLQMPIHYINQFIDEWNKGTKLVLSKKQSRKKGIKSKLASKYYNVYNSMTDDKILKDALDFQLMDRQIIDEICKIREIRRFFKGITGYLGYEYTLIEIEIKDRHDGESDFSSYHSLFKYALNSFVIGSTLPLKLSIIGGIIISCIAFIYMLITIIKTIAFGTDVPGYSSLMVVLLFGFGITYILLGIAGLYIGNIYEQVRRRPLYIVDETINMDEPK